MNSYPYGAARRPTIEELEQAIEATRAYAPALERRARIARQLEQIDRLAHALSQRKGKLHAEANQLDRDLAIALPLTMDSVGVDQ